MRFAGISLLSSWGFLFPFLIRRQRIRILFLISPFLLLRIETEHQRKKLHLPQKDISSFMVTRAERNCQTFETYFTAQASQFFYLPCLGTLRVEADWEIFLLGEPQREQRLGLRAPQPPLSNHGYNVGQKSHSIWQSKSLQSGSKNGIIFYFAPNCKTALKNICSFLYAGNWENAQQIHEQIVPKKCP